MDLQGLGRVLILVGIATAVIGVIFILGHRFGWGHLPGNITIHKGNVTIYIPLATMLIVSAVLTIIVNLWLRR